MFGYYVDCVVICFEWVGGEVMCVERRINCAAQVYCKGVIRGDEGQKSLQREGNPNTFPNFSNVRRKKSFINIWPRDIHHAS